MKRLAFLLCAAALACAKTAAAPAGLGEPCVGNGDCANGFLCVAARCVLPANLGGCEPGRLRCNGDDIEKCDSTGLSWQLQQTCATGCVSGACMAQVCTPGANRCAGDASEQCTPAGDAWALAQICPSLCDSGTGLCKAPVCTPFSTRCNPGGQICASNGASWQDQPCGANQVCDQGRCQDVICTAGATRCSGDGGSVQTCNAKGDGFDTTQSCSIRCASTGGVASCLAAQCTAGQQKCDQSAVEQCLPDLSGWGFVTFCATGCVSPSAGVAQCAAPVCAPFARQCSADGGSVQICKADGTGWAPGDTCPQGCSGGNCTTVTAGCNPGDLRCNGVDTQVCAQASPGVTQWNTTATCIAGCASGACLPGGSCTGVTLHAGASPVPGDGVSSVLVYSDPILGSDGSTIPDGQVFNVSVSSPATSMTAKTFAGRLHFKLTAPTATGADINATVSAHFGASAVCQTGSSPLPIIFSSTPNGTVLVAEDFTDPSKRNLAVANPASWDSADGAVSAAWPGDIGRGEDGALAVTAGIENLATDGHAPAYAVLGLAGRTVNVDAVAALSAGDEVVLWDAQGSSSGTANAGGYELHHVAAVSGSQVTLAEAVSGYFGAAADQDVLLQRVSLQRVPHFSSLTVAPAAVLTANPWDGTKGGLVFIRVSGTAKIQGDLRMDGFGFRGGRTGAGNVFGEDPTGSPALGGSGAGFANQGGSYGALGGGSSGSTYGLPLLGKLFLGAGGGGVSSAQGGSGGGAVVLFAGAVALANDAGTAQQGKIHADGAQSGFGAGSGAGGSVWVSTPSLTLGGAGTIGVSAAGGAPNGGFGGGAGRVRVDWQATDIGASCARANPSCNFGVAGALQAASLEEYNSGGLAIRAATLQLVVGAQGAAFSGAANGSDFGAIPSTLPGTLNFNPASSPMIGNSFRWKAQLTPAPGAPQTLLGLQWVLTVN